MQGSFTLGHWIHSCEATKQVLNRKDVIVIILSQSCLRLRSNLCKDVYLYLRLSDRHLLVWPPWPADAIKTMTSINKVCCALAWSYLDWYGPTCLGLMDLIWSGLYWFPHMRCCRLHHVPGDQVLHLIWPQVHKIMTVAVMDLLQMPTVSPKLVGAKLHISIHLM